MECGRHCDVCPAAKRCSRTPNFCLHGACDDCKGSVAQVMAERRAVMEHLAGLDLTWPQPVRHPDLPELPDHLPVLVQAYADPVGVPWVALHGGRVLGVTGRALTAKHRRPLREVYRLGAQTKIALQLYVEDRVLDGFWSERRAIMAQLAEMDFDLVLTPNFSVWRNAERFQSLAAERKAFAVYHEMLAAGIPAVPDVGFYLFEPDGRLWAEWINSQPTLKAVSIFCGGRKIHAEVRAHRETVEDVALLHAAVRPDVTFILGGIHSPARLVDYRRATAGRRLVICNVMAYSLAQRRRLVLPDPTPIARSAREAFLRNCRANDELYRSLLHPEEAA